LQALCLKTALGGMLHIKRGQTQPSIFSGSLHDLASALDYIILSKSPRNNKVTLDAATQEALQSEVKRNLSFASDLHHCFPNLYKFVKKYLFAQSSSHHSQMFFSRNDSTSIQSTIAEEEGNRFINEL